MVLIISAAAGSVRAQQIEWLIRDAPLAADAPDGVAHVEPHLAIDPADPGHFAVGTIEVGIDRTAGPWDCAVHVVNGGESVLHRFDVERCIDPWVAFVDPRALLFTATEITREGEGDDRFRLVLRRSEDGGGTWSDADYLGRTHEHTQMVRDAAGSGVWLAARRTTGAAGARRHVVWLARSADGGRSFEDVAEHDPGGDDVMVTGVVAQPDGVVLTYRNRQRPGAVEEAWSLAVGSDGAAHAPVRIGTCTAGGEDAFAGYPVAAGSGRLLVHACIGPRLEGVRVSRSTDGGRTWSRAVRADAASASPHARTPMLTLAGQVVGVAWYDRRHDDARACQDVYLALSVDGGASFGVPVRVTSETSCPQNAANGTVARSWPMGGDYGAFASASEGTFRLVWADARSGPFRLRTAVFRVRGP